MTLAALIAAVIGATFTAVAGIAALWTAWTAREEARLRSRPYVAAAAPTLSESGDELEIELKNLGLGPARLLGLQAESDGTTIGVYTSPGLAPMETVRVNVPLLLWTHVDAPSRDRVRVVGCCQDASGTPHPVYVAGQGILADLGAIRRYEALASRPEIAMRHQLKTVVRATRTGNPSLGSVAWMNFWLSVEGAGITPASVEEQVAADWASLGGAEDHFRRRRDLILNDADRRRYEAAEPAPALEE